MRRLRLALRSGSAGSAPRAGYTGTVSLYIALEAYRKRKVTTAQLRRLLGFPSRYELDGFLKEHEVWLEYTWKDLEHDRETHRRLGL